MADEEPTKLASSHMPGMAGPEEEQTRMESANISDAYPRAPLTGGAPRMIRGSLQIGDMLKDRFQVTDKLGEGGMGMVFKAIDLRKVEAKSHNPYIAIKVLHPDLAKNETLVAGLQRECEKAQQLSHPNIITVFDFDRDGDYVFMSMEFLSGQPLNKIIRETAPAGGIKLQRAWPIIQQMGKALAYAHRKGIVHSDFKPANAFVTDENEVKVLDFGIAAKTEHGTNPDATVFNARAEGGLTPPYASFEMINGAPADPRDDIYAFGLVVYEMLTGKHPYNRKPASTVFIEQQRAKNKPQLSPVKGLSRRQWLVLKAAIELLQEKRPKSLDEWLKEFEPQTRKWSPWSSGVVAILLVSIGGFIAWHNQSQQAEHSTPLETKVEPAVPEPVLEKNFATPAPIAFELPIAQAGGDKQGQVGQAIMFDATTSRTGDGEPLSYRWQILQAPSGSQAQLQDPESATPRLTPDIAGEYQVQLTVRDGHNRSAPVLSRLNIVEAPKPALSHQAISNDGLLSLAASKPQYHIGEKLRLNLHVTKAGYLRVVYVGANGEIAEVFPNQNQSSKVKADSTIQIPPRGAKFDLEVTGPVGNDKIVAVYSPTTMTNLEKVVDKNGDIASEYLLNRSKSVIQYAVVNK
ncbi:MAG: protein kinase domain-containing protein [Gammaproteobacteria bacterium]